MPVTSYLGLGSNIGNANQNIVQAIDLISAIDNVEVTNKASFYLSKAWGKTDQDDFINTVIEIKCSLSPEELLKSLKKVEGDMGRIKKEKWGPRIIDIDILTFADCEVNLPHLKIPHPYMTQRSFVMAPLYELNQSMIIANKGPIEEHINKKQIKSEILDVYVL